MKKSKTTKPKLNNFINRRNLLLFTFLVLIVGQVILTLETVTSGAIFSSLEDTKKDLHLKNGELTSRLIHLSSLKTAEEKSDKLGFYKPDNTIYLNYEKPIAQLR